MTPFIFVIVLENIDLNSRYTYISGLDVEEFTSQITANLLRGLRSVRYFYIALPLRDIYNIPTSNIAVRACSEYFDD